MQLSIQYGCSPATGDYGPLTVENLAASRLLFGGFDMREGGVIYWLDSSYVFPVNTTNDTLSNPVDGLLEPTQAGGIVSIDTGVAIVNGYLYFNDASVGFDINGNPGNANATDIIALRWTATAQTVRLVRLNGAASSTATLTQTGSIWEIPLAEVLLNGSGQFSTLTDVRKYAQSTLLPPTRTVRRFIQPMAAVAGDGVEYDAIAGMTGIVMPDAALKQVTTSLMVDFDFVSGLTITPIVFSQSSGNAQLQIQVDGGGCSENYQTIQVVGASTTEAITAADYMCVLQTAVPNVERGDFIHLLFARDGTDGNDTLADDLICVGFTVEYQGYDGNLP